MKCLLFIHIKYMIFKHDLLITFLSEPELIFTRLNVYSYFYLIRMYIYIYIYIYIYLLESKCTGTPLTVILTQACSVKRILSSFLKIVQ